VADRYVSVPMTLSDLERREASGQILQVDLLNNAGTIRPITTKFGRITHVGEEYISKGVNHAPSPRGRGPSGLQLWGSLLFVHIPFDAELSNLTW